MRIGILEYLVFRNKKINKKRPFLVAPLMKQWSNLMLIATEYLVMFTSAQIMDASGRPSTRSELLEGAQEEAEDAPCCFEKISLFGRGMGPIPSQMLAPGIEVHCSSFDDPTLFPWGEEYNYDVAGCSFTRVYYKDGGVMKEKWFLEDNNSAPDISSRSPAHWLLFSRESLSLGEDMALIWRKSKWVNGVLDQEDFTMHWTAKCVRFTY